MPKERIRLIDLGMAIERAEESGSILEYREVKSMWRTFRDSLKGNKRSKGDIRILGEGESRTIIAGLYFLLAISKEELKSVFDEEIVENVLVN